MISLIIAMDPNRLIGKDNSLPWSIKEDMNHFKNYTTGKAVLMGKKTFDSIGKPLANRNNIVVCNDCVFTYPGVRVEEDLFKVLDEYKNKDEELVVIGGATIYKLALPYVDKAVVSRIHKVYEGNLYFPEFEDGFVVESIERHDEFDVYIYRRK